ncbi:CD59 glycoprotein-like [Bufo gargarizans]|uniref:CD59 glycoprotein-like n=1 Tax=Bufo gargarizans TaxID=30331 RepID=UPI001CF44DC6|nr:CD59 glycoprotein-like [Bufo gargarizans]
MSSTGICGVVLTVGLVFLTLCSTGQAIECYKCNTFSFSQCATKEICSAPNDACARITVPDGTSTYSCRVYDKCTHAIVSQETGLQNFQLKCCQSSLCNSSFMSHPSTVLVLSLAAVLLLMMSS